MRKLLKKIGPAWTACLLILGWISQPFRIFGAENVRKTWNEAYQLDRSLTSQARKVCRAAMSEDPGAVSTTGNVLLVYESRYDDIAASYDAVISNRLEGGLVLPPNLQNKHKTLEQKLDEIGCTAPFDRIGGG